jgi:hypothetical protein
VVDKLKWNIFTFGKKFKFQMDFEIKIQETIPISNILEFERGSNFLGKFA